MTAAMSAPEAAGVAAAALLVVTASAWLVASRRRLWWRGWAELTAVLALLVSTAVHPTWWRSVVVAAAYFGTGAKWAEGGLPLPWRQADRLQAQLVAFAHRQQRGSGGRR